MSIASLWCTPERARETIASVNLNRCLALSGGYCTGNCPKNTSVLPGASVFGIFGATQAKALLTAGAGLVQIYTGLIYRDPILVRELVAELASVSDLK